MAKGLVIVESPTKTKALKSYLGDDYIVEASMGHVIDLPQGAMGIDVDHEFQAQYMVLPSKRKILQVLKSKVEEVQEIWLATDPDREGEAISWHLARVLGEGKQIYRVEFHEITKEAIVEAFHHPREVNMDLVNAQQARRILDRIVGYNLSPLLWEKVSKGLSAGRVQSVAVRLIVDREHQIRKFIPEEYWTCDVTLRSEKDHKHKFIAHVEKLDNEKISIVNKQQADAIVTELRDQQYIVQEVKNTKRTRSPLAPYTTSKLQQDAFNLLKFPVSKTMRVAQSLYEGIEIPGEGMVGLITYMRTDSVNIAPQAIAQVREFIEKQWGKEYLPKTPHVFKSGKAAQEAHEAIRPTSVHHKPENLKDILSREQYKLYELIWKRFISSQMPAAQLEKTSIDIKAGRFLLRATGQRVLFDGFLKVFRDAEEQSEPALPVLTAQQICELIGIEPKQHFTKPPARFSDASLVKILEELGIGRPSTYAPTITTIIDRNYVERRSGYFHPTELGELVTKLLVGHFPKILNTEFTAHVEKELDDIELGNVAWIAMLKNFYTDFTQQLNEAKIQMRSVKHEAEKLDEKCPNCGRYLVVKWGRHGKFISCSGFPRCKFSRSIATEIVCPNEGCGGHLIKRRSQRGRIFWGCSNYPKCTYITNKLPTADQAGSKEEQNKKEEHKEENKEPSE